MGLRFFRRQQIAPGITLNLSKSGASLSLGPKGAKVTVGPRGTQATIGLPGTGLSYTTHLSAPASSSSSSSKALKSASQKSLPSKSSAAAKSAPKKLSLGFFERLMTHPDERILIDGLKHLVDGHLAVAAGIFRQSEHPDAAWLSAVLALQQQDVALAIPFLEKSMAAGPTLGSALNSYGIEASFLLPITPELMVRILPSESGALLTLAEAYQWSGRGSDALITIERLIHRFPDDIVLKLSWIELLLLVRQGDPVAAQIILDATVNIPNETAIHAGCLLYRARAMKQLGLLEEARITLTDGLRRKANRPQELLLAMLYERALIYESTGERAKAKKDLHAINALDGNYEDVADRLANHGSADS